MMAKCETCRIKYKYCDYFLEYIDLKDDLVDYKCLYCNTSSQQKFDEKFKERFFNRSKSFCYDINKFILLLQKCVYPYEYMYD